MIARVRRGLTFANVCSLLALMIALGTGTAYAANTVFSEDIVNGEVKTPDIHAGAVTTGKIAGNAVTGGKVEDGTLVAADLANDSVGSAEIVASAVGASEIATDAVGATEVADSTIDGGEVVDNSLTASDLDSSSVGASEIATGAVGGAEIANESVTASDIKGVNSFGTISVTAGSVANGRCVDLTLTVPGAEPEQAVVLSLRAPAVAGMAFLGVRVPAAGQVLAKVCNFTGGASPEVDHLPIRLLTFG